MQAVQKHLNDQLALLASEKDRQKREETAIVFSLAVSLLVQKYKLDVNKDQVVGLLSAMALLPDTDNNTCSGYELVIAEFKNPRCVLSCLEVLVTFYNIDLDRMWTLSVTFVGWRAVRMLQSGSWPCLCVIF